MRRGRADWGRDRRGANWEKERRGEGEGRLGEGEGGGESQLGEGEGGGRADWERGKVGERGLAVADAELYRLAASALPDGNTEAAGRYSLRLPRRVGCDYMNGAFLECVSVCLSVYRRRNQHDVLSMCLCPAGVTSMMYKHHGLSVAFTGERAAGGRPY